MLTFTAPTRKRTNSLEHILKHTVYKPILKMTYSGLSLISTMLYTFTVCLCSNALSDGFCRRNSRLTYI